MNTLQSTFDSVAASPQDNPVRSRAITTARTAPVKMSTAKQRFTAQKPLLGILTSDEPGRLFGGNHLNFIDLIRAGKAMGKQVCVININHLKLNQKHTIGYIYQTKDNTWTAKRVALPRVLYNRIPTRKAELSPHAQRTIKAIIRHSRIHLFNPAFFNKRTLFEWIAQSPQSNRFLPETHPFVSPTVLEMMLSNHHFVYLKPTSGKAGKGIMRIERAGDTYKPSYRLSIQSAKRSHTSSHQHIPSLWKKIKSLIGAEEYIIQQGIVLARYKNRPFDLRVLLQKKRDGKWGLSGIGARVAGKRSITTHVPRGGRIDNPLKLLSDSFGNEGAMLIVEKAQQAALLVAQQIEHHSEGTLGEMSMDLGVDNNGMVWFFEANSRPMKFDEPDIRKRSLKRIIQYASYLSKTRKRSR